MSRVTDVSETVNQAIRFVKYYPCAICSYESSKTHKCLAGVKYKGTCKVYKELQARLCGVKEMEENP